VAAACYLGAEIYLLDGRLGFPLDDSWIHLQFARNLAAGDGLSYNPGRPVTGSTAPLWTAVLSLGFLLPGSPLVWAKVFGVACFVLLVPATHRLACELEVRPALAALAAALTALTGWLVWSSLSGMEIPLFALLSVTGITRHLVERRGPPGIPCSALLLALAVLARPEGVLLLGAAFVDRLAGLWPTLRGPSPRAARRTLLLWVALAGIVLVPTLVFYRLAGDGFLPTTYSAKAPGAQRWLPSLSYLYVVLGIFLPGQPWMALLALGGSLALVSEGLADARRAAFLPAAWLLGLPLAYSLISLPGPAVLVGNFGRYYFPLVPVLVVAGMVAVDRLAPGRPAPYPSLPGRPAARPVPGGSVPDLSAGASVATLLRGGRRLMTAVVVGLVLAPTVMDLGRGLERYTRSVLNVEDSDVAMARWLETRLPPEAVLAVNDIGALRFLLPNEVVDLAGIANPEIRHYFAAARARGEPWRAGIEPFLADQRPDYLVVFPSWFPGLVSDGSRYRPLHRIVIPDNITMGGDELVLYSTPWTRFPLRAP
jgi:hypothetical protein